jgi:hypothetical protein
VRIVRTTTFEKCLKKLGASKKEIARLEEEIAANPEAGDVIKGLEGARKIRFGMWAARENAAVAAPSTC